MPEPIDRIRIRYANMTNYRILEADSGPRRYAYPLEGPAPLLPPLDGLKTFAG